MWRKSVEARLLREADSIVVVCRGCNSRTEMLADALAGLQRAGIKTVLELREVAYCEHCDHAGENAQNLRFHAQWVDSPKIRVVSSSGDQQAA